MPRVPESKDPLHPLAEVFGFPVTNNSPQARRARKNRLCCYNNRSPNCTKVSVKRPLGVCSVYEKGQAVITCPIRFRQDWLVAEDASAFFFPEGSQWTSLTEVRLKGADGALAGNIDLVLVSYDDGGLLIDFGALEIQSVYISGNMRDPFEAYMSDPDNGATFQWVGQPQYPRPDYLSSSRKRLAPQLLFKGGILNSWGKRMAVALHNDFFSTLPELPEVSLSEAEIAWLVYKLRFDTETRRFMLERQKSVYTRFAPSLATLTVPKAGLVTDFVAHLQHRLERKLNNSPDVGPPRRSPFDGNSQ